MSRPFDVWALGCVFLELLLWFLNINEPDPDPNNHQCFVDMRLDERWSPNSTGEDHFWQHRHKNDFELNGAVRQVLDDLRNVHCVELPLFRELVKVIEDLLAIQPSARPKAGRLVDMLDYLLTRAVVEVGRPALKPKQVFSDTSAPIERLFDDVSTTGDTRAEAVARSMQEDAESAANPVATIDDRPVLQQTGQQFSAPIPLAPLNSPQPNNDDVLLTDEPIASRSFPRPGVTGPWSARISLAGGEGGPVNSGTAVADVGSHT